MTQEKKNEIDPTPILPLGEEGRNIPPISPGDVLKNVPKGYSFGSVNRQIDYWKTRALAAEARVQLRLEELEKEKEATQKLVVIESPFAGDVSRNKTYLDALLVDSLKRGEYPYASHGFFPQVLDDNIPEERALGIKAGLAWAARGSKTILATDLGISKGMQLGVDAAKIAGRPVEERSLKGWKK